MGFFDLMFGCSHHRLSFPITVRGARRRSKAASVTGTYVVCLECGQEFPYDWKEMKVVRRLSSTSATAVPEPRRAA
jgi:hypothetical protein